MAVEVEPLRCQGRENTFIGALDAAARAMGDEAGYPFLMGASGAAFRIQFHQPDWCPSSPDGMCGFDCARKALVALGREGSFHFESEAGPELRRALSKSIDAGRPALGAGLIGPLDWGVITGPGDDPRRPLCLTYWNKGESPEPAEKWPIVLLLLGGRTDRPDRSMLFAQSFDIARELWSTPAYEHYASGAAAYSAWAGDLRDEARFGSLDPEELTRLQHINGWCYLSLCDARKSALAYLREAPPEIRVEHALRLFGEVCEILEGARAAAPMPWQLAEGERWTSKMRQREAEALDAARGVEARAVEALP